MWCINKNRPNVNENKLFVFTTFNVLCNLFRRATGFSSHYAWILLQFFFAFFDDVYSFYRSLCLFIVSFPTFCKKNCFFFLHFVVVTLVVRINGYVLFIYLSVFLLKIFHSNEVIFCSSISLLLHIFTIYENHLSSIFAAFFFHIHTEAT